MDDLGKTTGIVMVLYSVLTLVAAALASFGIIKKECSPFSGPTNGFSKSVCANEEKWDKAYQFQAKQRIICSTIGFFIGLVLLLASLPSYMVILLFVIGSTVAGSLPAILTYIYGKRL